MEWLFARLDAHLKEAGYLAMGGQIVHASINAALRPRMTDEGTAIVKGGGIQPERQAQPRKPAQKDRMRAGPRSAGARRSTPMAALFRRSPRRSSATNPVSTSTAVMALFDGDQ
ncbi:MAG: hypothetical protein AAF844_18680 [Pseudomonadota bacterium]